MIYPINATVGRATALPAHYVPAPLQTFSPTLTNEEFYHFQSTFTSSKIQYPNNSTNLTPVNFAASADVL